MARNEKVICLFDVDGTLTEPRKEAEPDMLAFLQELRKARARTRSRVSLAGSGTA
jgi:hydroxymethylpyrimidine pyrophosphatase-like HAD family hydrolase